MVGTYTGKPRGGKSYGALKNKVRDEALYGDRVIVTNLAIDPAEFQQYLHDVYPSCDFDVNKRLVIISKEEAKRFWLIRGPAPADRVVDTTLAEQKAGVFPDFGPQAGNGVLYIIDEAHVLFDSRAWASNGLALTYYNSQHGKLGDDVVFITQFLGLLDKRCTGFSQSFHVFRNFRFEKVFTFFRAPGSLEERVYSVEPKRGVDPDEVHSYKIDLRLAKCYDTSAGVGITGRNRPEKVRLKGMHFGWFIGILLGAVGSLWFVTDIPAWLFLKSDGGEALAKGVAGIPSPTLAQSSAPALEPVPVWGGHPETLGGRELEKPYVVGYVAMSGRVNVILSDDTVLTEGDPQLERIDRTSVVVDGRRLPIKSRYREQGSGAKRAPVRPDTEVPGVAVPVITGRNSTVAEESSGPVAPANESTPPHQQHGSWHLDSDGIARLTTEEYYVKQWR